MCGCNLLEKRRCLRQVLAHCVGQGACAPQKDSAVPVIVAGGDEFLGLFLVGLFGESAYALYAGLQCASGLDVAVTGFCTSRHHAQHYDVFARSSQRNATLECRQKVRLIVDDVIRRENAEYGVRGGLLHQECGQTRGGSGVARGGLTQHLILRNRIELYADSRREQIVGDDPGGMSGSKWEQTIESALDHRTLAIQRQHLLGPGLPTAWPEASAAAPGQNDGTEVGLTGHRFVMVTDGRPYRLCTQGLAGAAGNPSYTAFGARR